MKARANIVAFCYDKQGKLLGAGQNSYEKSHPLQAYFAKKVGHPKKIFLHAELAAILRCKEKPIHSIRVYRYGPNGQTLLAKPCPICMEAIKAFDIQEVWYSNEQGVTVKWDGGHENNSDSYQKQLNLERP